MTTQRITFTGATGAPLAARLDLPDGPVRAAALFAHCFTCSKDIAAARRIAGRLQALGFAVLRFDFTGLGHSGGEFANTNFTSNVGDVQAAADWMVGQGMVPQLLIGHSLGGAAALKAAPQIASLRAVVTIGAPADPGHVIHNFGSKIDEIETHGSASVALAGRSFEIRKQFLDDVSRASLADALPRLKAALLVMHAPRDETVGIENASQIFMGAKHPKSFVSLDDADHLVSRGADAEYAADVISSWAARYVVLAPEPQLPDVPEGVVHVSEAHTGPEVTGFLQDIRVGSTHQLLADEPAAVGGTDLGPSPYQLVSSGLGACTTMTVRMYARRKGIALAHVAVDVTHNKCHLSEGQAGSGKADVFTRRIRLTGDLSEAERQKLLEIADKCPVHRTLHGQAVIETELV